MEDARSYKYYRSYGSGFYSLIHQFLLVDTKLRYLLNLGPHCGLVTVLTAALLAVVALCSLATWRTLTSDEENFRMLQDEMEKTAPRKKSIAAIKPAYNCVHKHLQQTDVFQEKSGKMLRKEQLELEILNSRISCIAKLLDEEVGCFEIES